MGNLCVGNSRALDSASTARAPRDYRTNKSSSQARGATDVGRSQQGSLSTRSQTSTIFQEANAAATSRESRLSSIIRKMQVLTVTGPSAPRTNTEKQASLERNLFSAREAITEVKSLTTASLNRPSTCFTHLERDQAGKITSATIKSEMEAPVAQFKKTRNMARVAQSLQTHALESDGVNMTDLRKNALKMKSMVKLLHENAQAAAPSQVVANCGENAYLAFDLMAKKEDNPTLEIVRLASNGEPITAYEADTNNPIFLENGPDHVFVLIGRDTEDSEITDPRTWNSDAVICDAWAQRSYPASDIRQELGILSGVTGVSNDDTVPIQTELIMAQEAETNYDPHPQVLHPPISPFED